MLKKKFQSSIYIIFFVIFILPGLSFSQQITDTTYNPIIKSPEYEVGKGPVIFIDEGHYNLNTKNGRYKPFANLLEKDGYNVKEFNGVFNKKELAKGKILVISNALNENVEDWVISNPSAFTQSEINEIKEWVHKGGSLFLIADHMPIADASKALAKVFGFDFTNGFVFDSLMNGTAYFSLKDKTLIENVITQGRDSTERINEIVSFTGQAFRIPDDAISILRFNKNYVNYIPDTSWVFDKNTTKINAEGWSQGAYKEFGKGKIVVFGEAAMFTAQFSGPEKRKGGMNSEIAPQNYQLLLNIIHWLDGKFD